MMAILPYFSHVLGPDKCLQGVRDVVAVAAIASHSREPKLW